MDYMSKGKSDKERLDVVDGGFPSNTKMFLGSHMANNPDWGALHAARVDGQYNITFQEDLGLVFMKDIEAGAEIYVDYYYNGKVYYRPVNYNVCMLNT